MKAIVFVSYSHDDEPFVTQIVRLLRAAIAGVPSLDGHHWQFVYQDLDHIPPGADWAAHVDEAIGHAERVFVFWCAHAARSEQVRREYELALRLSRVVVPVLLDDCPLPDGLSRPNGVDLRLLGTHRVLGMNLDSAPGASTSPSVLVRSFMPAVIGSFAPTLGITAPRMVANLVDHDPELA